MENVKNHPVATVVAAFVRLWTFRLGFPGCGKLIAIVKRLFPGIQRYYLEYPGLGRCDIAFLDWPWLRQQTLGPKEERSLLERLALLVPPSAVIWDVGANSGYFAAELLLRLKPARLELFEPNQSHRRTLESLAGLDSRVGVHMIGLSDTATDCILYVPGKEGSGSTCASVNAKLVSNAAELHETRIRLEVADEVLDGGMVAAPELVVIDVEGHEASVIGGMVAILRKHRPIVVLEHIFISDDAMRQMVPEEYAVFTVCDDDARLVAGIHRELGHNSVLLPKETYPDGNPGTK